MIVEMYECMYGTCICKMQTQRPPSQTRSRRRQETHTQGQRKQCVSAHRCRLKTAGRESRENAYTQKFSDTAIYIVYIGTVKGTEPEDTAIAKGTDKVNGTETGNGMAQGR